MTWKSSASWSTKRARSGRLQPRLCARWVFRTLSHLHFWKTTNARLSKKLSKNSKRSKRKPTEKIREVVSAVIAKYDYLEIGVHLHSRPDQAAAKIIAAYEAGCRRFDSAIGGLGGCPFAQDELVGNIPTETVIETLRGRGAQLPALKSLDTLLRATAEIGARYKI